MCPQFARFKSAVLTTLSPDVRETNEDRLCRECNETFRVTIASDDDRLVVIDLRMNELIPGETTARVPDPSAGVRVFPNRLADNGRNTRGLGAQVMEVGPCFRTRLTFIQSYRGLHYSFSLTQIAPMPCTDPPVLGRTSVDTINALACFVYTTRYVVGRLRLPPSISRNRPDKSWAPYTRVQAGLPRKNVCPR